MGKARSVSEHLSTNSFRFCQENDKMVNSFIILYFISFPLLYNIEKTREVVGCLRSNTYLLKVEYRWTP